MIYQISTTISKLDFFLKKSYYKIKDLESKESVLNN